MSSVCLPKWYEIEVLVKTKFHLLYGYNDSLISPDDAVLGNTTIETTNYLLKYDNKIIKMSIGKEKPKTIKIATHTAQDTYTYPHLSVKQDESTLASNRYSSEGHHMKEEQEMKSKACFAFQRPNANASEEEVSLEERRRKKRKERKIYL